jgi:hypothetical protein
MSPNEWSWALTILLCAAVFVREYHARSSRAALMAKHKADLDGKQTAIEDLGARIANDTKAITQSADTIERQTALISELSRANIDLVNETKEKASLLTARERELSAKANHIASLERGLDEERQKNIALVTQHERRQASPRPSSPLEIPYSEALQITPLVAAMLNY